MRHTQAQPTKCCSLNFVKLLPAEGTRYPRKLQGEHSLSHFSRGDLSSERSGSHSQPAQFKFSSAPFTSVTGAGQPYENGSRSVTCNQIDSDSTSAYKTGNLQRLQPAVNSSSSDTDMSSTPVCTPDLPEVSSRMLACGIRDEPVAPGNCLASPQASPWRQLCSEMQQVDVDQHSPELGHPGLFRQLDLQLGQLQSQLFSGGGALISTPHASARTDRLPAIQQGMHSESATPSIQPCDPLVTPGSSEVQPPPASRPQPCSPPGGEDLSTTIRGDKPAAAGNQEPDSVLHEPSSGMQRLHGPSPPPASTCSPAACPISPLNCGALESSNTDKQPRSSQGDSRSTTCHVDSSLHGSLTSEHEGSSQSDAQGTAAPEIESDSSDVHRTLCCAPLKATEVAVAEDRGEGTSPLLPSNEASSVSDGEEHQSAVEDAVLAELVSDVACASFSEATASHSNATSSFSSQGAESDANEGVGEECNLTAPGCAHDEDAFSCASDEQSSHSSCQPHVAEQPLSVEQQSADRSFVVLLANSADADAVPVPSLSPAGTDADTHTATSTITVLQSLLVPSDHPVPSGCTQSAAANQPESTTQPSREQAICNPTAAEQPPQQSMTISVGGLSDMSSMMDPGRGATQVAASSNRLVRNAPPSLLIAQSNPLYNSSPDSDTRQNTPGQSCQEPPLSTPGVPEGEGSYASPVAECDRDNETTSQLVPSMESCSIHESSASSMQNMKAGAEPIPRHSLTSDVGINQFAPQFDSLPHEASTDCPSSVGNAADACIEDILRDMPDTLHDPDMLVPASLQDEGLF